MCALVDSCISTCVWNFRGVALKFQAMAHKVVFGDTEGETDTDRVDRKVSGPMGFSPVPQIEVVDTSLADR